MITKPMLAETCSDTSKLSYPVLASPKIDGIRALKVNGQLVSRKFKPIPNEHIRLALEALLPDGADGEITVGDTFQSCSSGVMSKDGAPSFHYYWFDYVSSSLDQPYSERVETIERHADFHGLSNLLDKVNGTITIVRPEVISSAEELLKYEQEQIELGFEGIMVRKPDGKYKCGRSTEKEALLLKIKQFEDAEAIVLDTYELMNNTNEATVDELGHTKRSSHKEGLVGSGKLGGFLVRGVGGVWDGVEFDLGGFRGVTHAERRRMWESRDLLKGRLAKFSYFMTGSKDKPRFPIFLGFRHPNDT